jgi:hypothetical protein
VQNHRNDCLPIVVSRSTLWKKQGSCIREECFNLNLIGWGQTLTTSPPNHIHFSLIRAKKSPSGKRASNCLVQKVATLITSAVHQIRSTKHYTEFLGYPLFLMPPISPCGRCNNCNYLNATGCEYSLRKRFKSSRTINDPLSISSWSCSVGGGSGMLYVRIRLRKKAFFKKF